MIQVTKEDLGDGLVEFCEPNDYFVDFLRYIAAYKILDAKKQMFSQVFPVEKTVEKTLAVFSIFSISFWKIVDFC